MAWLTGSLQNRPCGPRAHQDCSPRHRQTRSYWERQKKFKSRTTNRWSNSVSETTRRSWQWYHAGGQFRREQWRLWICQVDQKPTLDIGQHAVPCGIYQQTGNYTRGISGRDQCHRPTNCTLLPHLRAWNQGACRRRYQPDQKPPRQCRHTAVWNPDILSVLTPRKNFGQLGLASAIPLHWGRRRRSPSAHMRLPACPPPRSQQHDIWGLPGLGVSKSRRSFGWRNHRGW